ncbi:MAG: hypothetical protein ACLRWQ_11740 [Flavonifractor plautii]
MSLGTWTRSGGATPQLQAAAGAADGPAGLLPRLHPHRPRRRRQAHPGRASWPAALVCSDRARGRPPAAVLRPAAAEAAAGIHPDVVRRRGRREGHQRGPWSAPSRPDAYIRPSEPRTAKVYLRPNAHTMNAERPECPAPVLEEGPAYAPAFLLLTE